jgi:hypothetical protein
MLVSILTLLSFNQILPFHCDLVKNLLLFWLVLLVTSTLGYSCWTSLTSLIPFTLEAGRVALFALYCTPNKQAKTYSPPPQEWSVILAQEVQTEILASRK